MMITALPRRDSDEPMLIIGLCPKDLRQLHLRNFATIPKVDLERVGVTGLHEIIIAAGDSDQDMVNQLREELPMPVHVEKRTRPCS